MRLLKSVILTRGPLSVSLCFASEKGIRFDIFMCVRNRLVKFLSVAEILTGVLDTS